MNSDPVVLSPVVMNSELEKAVYSAVDAADIRAAILAEAEKQSAGAAALVASQAEADKKVADAAAAKVAESGSKFERVEVIGGREFTFEADSELELERVINNAFKVAYAVQTPEDREQNVLTRQTAKQHQDELDAAAKAAETEKVANLAELELKFKRGEITGADYIEQSGALDTYLEKKGISIDSLKATVEKNQSSEFEQSWADATEEFLHSSAGGDWPGGMQNLEMIGLKVAALGLIDAQDKVAALAQAYASMKATNMVFPGEAAVATTTTVVATTTQTDAERQAAIKAAAEKMVADAAAAARATETRRTVATSSSIFGASSGVAGAGSTEKAVADKVKVDPNASPAEIMDAWKKAQLAEGKNPNDAFIEQHAGRRA